MDSGNILSILNKDIGILKSYHTLICKDINYKDEHSDIFIETINKVIMDLEDSISDLELRLNKEYKND